MRVAVAADHAGFELKGRVVEWLKANRYDVLDLGTDSVKPVDYPDFAEALGSAVLAGRAVRGVLICGSGVGAAVAVNKLPGIRAGLCHDTYSAHQGVEHDDMNVLVLGARVIGAELALELIRAFLGAQFSGAERHVRRLAKIKALEERGAAMAERRVLDDAPALARAAAQWIAERAAEAVAARGRCAVALAGGQTPRAAYEMLRQRLGERLPWERVDVYFSDERCVPPDDPDSNYRMASEALLAHVPIPAAQIHRMHGERPDREAAARDYDETLPETLDILLLGMGTDGHTASLFPGSRALGEEVRRVVAVRGPKPPPWRLTITPPVISAARHVAVLVSGVEKAAAVAQALAAPYRPRELPIQLALKGAWFLDAAAASQWRGTTR